MEYLTFEDLKFEPHPHEPENGVLAAIRFDNNFGVSVIRTPYSNGGAAGLYELAVIYYRNATQSKIVYNTEIADGVVGHLTPEDVTYYMKRVQRLQTPQN